MVFNIDNNKCVLTNPQIRMILKDHVTECRNKVFGQNIFYFKII